MPSPGPLENNSCKVGHKTKVSQIGKLLMEPIPHPEGVRGANTSSLKGGRGHPNSVIPLQEEDDMTIVRLDMERLLQYTRIRNKDLLRVLFVPRGNHRGFLLGQSGTTEWSHFSRLYGRKITSWKSYSWILYLTCTNFATCLLHHFISHFWNFCLC